MARALGVMPVVVLTGARQTGKSTLVQQTSSLGDRPYLSLDDLTVRDRAQNAAPALVREAPQLALDEVQRVPDLLISVKAAVDEQRSAGRFLLTGSANLLLLEAVSETLAGRATYLELWPMTRREQRGLGRAGLWSELLETETAQWRELLLDQESPKESWRDFAARGGYPTPALELGDRDSRSLWFEGYATTYLERDLRDLTAIDRLVEFRRLMQIVCLRIGGIQNQADIARDAALPPTTVQRYLDVLEVSYQLVRVPAFAVNRTKRLVKSPKLYWSDAGLGLHLAGETEPRGAHFENLVLCDLRAWAGAQVRRTSVLHWRTTKGAEVDFVVETPDRVLPIELKSSGRPRVADARHLRTFLDEYSDVASAGLLLHGGAEAYWLAERVLAAPWWMVL